MWSCRIEAVYASHENCVGLRGDHFFRAIPGGRQRPPFHMSSNVSGNLNPGRFGQRLPINIGNAINLLNLIYRSLHDTTAVGL